MRTEKETLDLIQSLPADTKGIAVRRSSPDQKYRCHVEEGGSVFVYPPRRRNKGWRYSNINFANMFDFEPVENKEAEKWEKNVVKVIKRLQRSGLWPNILELYEGLHKLGYENRKVLQQYIDLDFRNRLGYKVEIPQDLVEKVEKIYQECPFAFLDYRTEQGYRTVNSDYVWEISNAEIKSMYFGKYANTRVKEEIKQALDMKQPYEYHTTVNYDVSYSYDPEKNVAYYSEEYRGCGNGHYYIALDENAALFCEND